MRDSAILSHCPSVAERSKGLFIVRSATIVLALCAVFGIATEQRSIGETVDFEEVGLEPESAWIGPVSAESGTESSGDFGGTVRSGVLESNGVQFTNRFNLDFGSWSGFAVSNRTDNTTEGFTLEPSVITGAGFDSSSNYAAAFGYVGGLDPTKVEELERLPYFDIPDDQRVMSAHITNTTYTALSMLNGDPFAKRFGGATRTDEAGTEQSGDDPDFLRLTIYGADVDRVPLSESVELYLADYRFEDNQKDYVLREWVEVDFSPLLNADRIYFNLDSTDIGQFGMNTPAYFAIDNIVLVEDSHVDVLGDVTGDGRLSVADVDTICGGIFAKSSAAAFDLNGDGFVSSTDLAVMLAAADRFPGDADFNGEVAFADFLVLSANFGMATTWSHGDFDCNGEVEFGDYLILAENFGQSAEFASVPEPSSTVLVFVGAIAFLLCKRRYLTHLY